MNIIPAEDEVILGLCFHGQSEALDKSTFKPAWLQSDVSRSLVDACISLARDGKEVNAISAISRAKISMPGLTPEIIRIAKNGFGQSVLGDAVDHSYQVFINNKAIEIADEMKRLAQHEPQNISKWLAREATSMVNLIHDGDTYDARPSVHAQKKLPGILTHSLITNMDAMLRGYYRDALLLMYAGVTSMGKSLTLKSHAVDLTLQKFRVAFIITENTEQKVSAQIAASLASVDYESEVVTKKFKATETESPEERQSRYNRMLKYLDEYLLVYGPDYCNDSNLKRIAKWEKPDAIIIDYLKKQPGLFTKSVYGQDEVGEFSNFLLKFAMSEGICVLTAGQMSKDAAKKFLKNGSTEDVILYGSALPEYASDEFITLRRHPSIKNCADFIVKKYRDGGPLNTRHEINLDVKRSILEIKKLSVGDNIREDF